MTRPFYDTDDTPFRGRYRTRGGWGLLAPQVFGIGHYPPSQRFSARPVCAETDPDLFFPEQSNAWMAQIARRVCSGCPIKAECLEAAVARREEHGIWGGTTPKQRQRMWLRRAKFEAEGIPA